MTQYTLRVTRIPLTPSEREEMRAAGTLPEDQRFRQLEAEDVVRVEYEGPLDDAALVALGLMETVLKFGGERVLVELREDTGSFRLLTPREGVRMTLIPDPAAADEPCIVTVSLGDDVLHKHSIRADLMKPFADGFQAGLESPDTLESGMTYDEPEANEAFDSGVNYGQAAARATLVP